MLMLYYLILLNIKLFFFLRNSLFYAIRYNAQEIFNYLIFDVKHEINGCSKVKLLKFRYAINF